jgi:hypothetical protein
VVGEPERQQRVGGARIRAEDGQQCDDPLVDGGGGRPQVSDRNMPWPRFRGNAAAGPGRKRLIEGVPQFCWLGAAWRGVPGGDIEPGGEQGSERDPSVGVPTRLAHR